MIAIAGPPVVKGEVYIIPGAPAAHYVQLKAYWSPLRPLTCPGCGHMGQAGSHFHMASDPVHSAYWFTCFFCNCIARCDNGAAFIPAEDAGLTLDDTTGESDD